jgi:formylglycine-generating enzyme required for sulfatase activity
MYGRWLSLAGSVLFAAVSTLWLGAAAAGQAVICGDGCINLPLIARGLPLSDPSPADGAANQSLNTYLAWRLAAPDAANARFTLLLEANDATPDLVVAEGLTHGSYDGPTLAPDTTYYWQVLVTSTDPTSRRSPPPGGTDLLAAHSAGPVWSFHTEAPITAPPIGTEVEVPAGEFRMGCDPAYLGPEESCKGWELPLHTVWLDRYAIDKFEVTNVEYRACVAAGACDGPRRINSHTRDRYYKDYAFDLYPVLYVSRLNALQYCTWAGKRLPTEAEWEKAARGPIDTRPFPWGSEPTDCTRQNRPDAALCGEEGLLDTTRVGLFPRGASPYGAHDMSGNVFEWTSDRFEEGWYQKSPYANPANPPRTAGDLIVIRGGSYRDRFAYLTTYHRHFAHHGDAPGEDAPHYRSDRLGFRCARSLP